MYVFINLLKAKYGPVPFSVIQQDPYGVRPIRKLIDSCAFNIYGHWVKRSNDQNRGALFENTLRVYEYQHEQDVFSS